MAKLVFAMNQSLDGYVDHEAFPPGGPVLFAHWCEFVRNLAGSVYGRRLYEIMRYWDEDQPEWTPLEHAFATAWRVQQKWVVSRTMKTVGPNTILIRGDLEAAVRELKAQAGNGEIQVGGPALAQSLTDLGLIDEYRLYLCPVVLVKALRSSPVHWRRCVSWPVTGSARTRSGLSTFPLSPLER